MDRENPLASNSNNTKWVDRPHSYYESWVFENPLGIHVHLLRTPHGVCFLTIGFEMIELGKMSIKEGKLAAADMLMRGTSSLESSLARSFYE
jgi:hypothetical protein